MKHCKRGLRLLAVAILATGLLAACTAEGDTGNQAVSDLEEQVAALQAEVQGLEQQLQEEREEGSEEKPILGDEFIRVVPPIWKFPEERIRTPGDVWFIGGGLEPGQWFRITVHRNGELGELMEFANDELRQANEEGAFALSTPSIRPGRFQGVPVEWEEPGGAWVVKVWDMETDALLATTTWVVCGSDRENIWCDAAEETALLAEAGGEAQ